MSEDYVVKVGPFKGMKIRSAPTQIVDQHRVAVDRVLEAIEEALEIEGIFVSDLSSLSDFRPNLDQLTIISTKLGIPVSEHDLICDIAMRLNPKN